MSGYFWTRPEPGHSVLRKSEKAETKGDTGRSDHSSSRFSQRKSDGPDQVMEEAGRDAARVEEMERLERRVGELEGLLERERANAEKQMERDKRMEGLVGQSRRKISELESQSHRKDRQISELAGQSQGKDFRIAELESNVRKVRGDYDGAMKQIRAITERLKQSEELSAARSAELSGTHTFLSTTDRLSEVEVLGVVRDLNENIFQVAVILTDEWGKLEPSRATRGKDTDPTSRPSHPVLTQLVRNRDHTGSTLLLQSLLCFQVVAMTSSWSHDKELTVLQSVYERLSASEGQAISARWRSLTHSHLPKPPHRSGSLVAALAETLAKALDETGSFSSTQQSLAFVRTTALEGIETIVQLSLHAELAFMVEVTSSDMSLLFEAPGTVFDGERMGRDNGFDGVSAPKKRDKIVGTTELGVRKCTCTGPGESRREEILLKTTVVLDKDLTGRK